MRLKLWTTGGIVGSETKELYDLTDITTVDLSGKTVEQIEEFLDAYCGEELLETAIQQARFEWGWTVVEEPQ